MAGPVVTSSGGIVEPKPGGPQGGVTSTSSIPSPAPANGLMPPAPATQLYAGTNQGDVMIGRGGSVANPWAQAAPADGSNPYTSQLAGDVNALYPATQQAANTQASLTQQATQLGGSLPASTSPTSGGASPAGSSYPAYPNSAGLGNTSAFSSGGAGGTGAAGSVPAASPPSAISNPVSYAGNPVNADASATTTNGFNPWSMTGEANSRF